MRCPPDLQFDGDIHAGGMLLTSKIQRIYNNGFQYTLSDLFAMDLVYWASTAFSPAETIIEE